MIRSIYIILMACTLLVSSCGSRRTRLERNDLIPDKQLVSLLTDIYLTDGLIGFPRVAQKFSPLDSSTTYDYIIQKHGYTREDLNRTLKYYFVRNPKKMIRIYDKVLGILSEMESRIQKDLLRSRQDAETIWKGPESFYYPDPGTSDSTSFDLTIKRPGFYTLSETVTLFPDDQTLNPGLSAVTFNPDSTDTGKRYYINTFPFIKDGQPHTYDISFRVPLRTTLRIKGNLYGSGNNPDDWDRHIVIQNVVINYSILEK